MAKMLARPAGLEPATPSLEGLGLQLRSAEVCGSGSHSDKNEAGTKGLATRVAPELHRGQKRPRVLIGYSCCPLTLEAFERAGCDAWTCDLLPSRGRPDRHIQADVWSVLDQQWGMALLHPMCTCLTVSAAWAFNDPDFDRYPGVGYHQKVKPETLTGQARRDARDDAIANFRRLERLPYPTAIENPAPSFICKAHRRQDQIIQPHDFGDDASKGTGLWLRGLPKLRSTGRVFGRIVNGKERWANQTDSGQNRVSPGDDLGLSALDPIPALRRRWAGNGARGWSLRPPASTTARRHDPTRYNLSSVEE